MFKIPNNKNFLKAKVLVRRNRCLWWLMLFILSTSLYFIVRYCTLSKNSRSKIGEHISQYLIFTTGCQIPIILPDRRAKILLKSKPEAITCIYRNSTEPLVLSDDSSLWVDEHALLSYGINDSQHVKCCYTELYRPTVKGPKDTGPPYLYGRTCQPFWKKENVSMEFVRINCTNNGTLFYTDFHYFVPIKSHVENRCKQLSQTNEKMNVLILGLDATSRSNFHRAMNKTSNLLKDMGAIEMLGYNKVGLNTVPNMVPVATGLFFEELRSTCMKKGKGYLDSCKFIWKDFESLGYRTAFIEDSEHDVMYEHIGKGFYRAPTDYYAPTFYHAAEKEIGVFKNKINFCIGTRLLYETLLTYVEKFVKSMADRPYFGFFWECSLTHEGVNLGKFADDSYLLVLKSLSQHASFNNTVLIVMGDHGYQRDSEFSKTMFGRFDTRKPLLSFVFPKWFHHKYMNAIKNIKTNSKRLATHFDLHETLKDLSNHAYYLNDRRLLQRTRELENGKLPRGISLFLPIPEKRTCVDAEIPFRYCSCENTARQKNDYKLIEYLSRQVIIWINKQIRAYPHCATVSLSKVLYANLGTSAPRSVNDHMNLNWHLIIEAEPGRMTFEASGRTVDAKRLESLNSSVEVVEYVDPLSTYRYRSHCENNKTVKPFCFCIV